MIQRKLFVVILAGILTAALRVNAGQVAGPSFKSVDAAADDAKVSRVLYINSYDRGYSWSDDIERGLVEHFKNADRKIELSVEYLDGRRFPGTDRNDLMAAALAAKYTGYRQDVVVVSDNFAFDFAIQYRQRLFPDLPIVFCGFNNFRPEVLKGTRNITGVNEEVDFAKTVDLALQVQPAVGNLAFITSTGDASNKRMAEVVEATLFPELRKRYHLIALKDASMAGIGAHLGALPRDSAVFLIGMTSDLVEGRRPTPVENGRMIAAVSPVPVYSFWDFELGTGILGGQIITGLDQGRAAAEMALRILGGTPADAIPVMMRTPARNIFDFNVMKKFGIKMNALPEGCSFINRPVSLWESYGWYIGAAVLAMSLESLLIIALVLSLRHRKEALRMLGVERDLLEQHVEARTGELRRANALLEEEIRVRSRTERVITARLRLLEFAATHPLDELLETTINEAEALTGSSIGFYHFLGTDQKTLSLQNWSTRTKAEFCKAEGKGLHYDVAQAGVWVDCIRQRRPVIHNDYASLSHRKGMPPDHARLIRELVLPVFRGDSIVAIIGVGNKPHDYTVEDIEAVSFLADFAWEIAERKQAEEVLHLARFCIDKAGIGIYQSDENGTIFNVNEYACSNLGYSRDELCSLTIFDIDPEITPERMLALKELVDETGFATHYSTHRRKEGSTFPVEITANIIDFRGKRYGISFVKDITERKRAEEALQKAHDELENRVTLRTRELMQANAALQESEEKYRLIAENSNDWIYLIDPDGKLQYVSPSSERVTGYSAVEFMQNPQLFMSIIHPDDQESVRSHQESERKETKSGHLEYRIITKQGERRWIMHSCLPVYNDQGEYIGRSGTNRDFTERKHAEDTLRLLSSRLLTSQEEEQRRIAMELHDQTGQDILFLKLQLQALKRRLRKDQDNLKNECDKILTLTDRIIEDVRRLAHGLSPSQLQALGLRTAVKALIQNFSDKTRIPIHHDVEALDNGFRLETEIVLYRIFQEALTNIYKHAQAKTVRIDVFRQGNTLSISIKDDGQGFVPYRDRTDEPTLARGMGLSALELRSRMIGADLKISSQPGQGTEINLFMPVKGNSEQ
jgi:PAS domain S-box-containing protein